MSSLSVLSTLTRIVSPSSDHACVHTRRSDMECLNFPSSLLPSQSLGMRSLSRNGLETADFADTFCSAVLMLLNMSILPPCSLWRFCSTLQVSLDPPAELASTRLFVVDNPLSQGRKQILFPKASLHHRPWQFVATCRVARLTLQTLVSRPFRALPSTCPIVENSKIVKKNQKIKKKIKKKQI